MSTTKNQTKPSPYQTEDEEFNRFMGDVESSSDSESESENGSDGDDKESKSSPSSSSSESSSASPPSSSTSPSKPLTSASAATEASRPGRKLVKFWANVDKKVYKKKTAKVVIVVEQKKAASPKKQKPLTDKQQEVERAVLGATNYRKQLEERQKLLKARPSERDLQELDFISYMIKSLNMEVELRRTVAATEETFAAKLNERETLKATAEKESAVLVSVSNIAKGFAMFDQYDAEMLMADNVLGQIAFVQNEDVLKAAVDKKARQQATADMAKEELRLSTQRMDAARRRVDKTKYELTTFVSARVLEEVWQMLPHMPGFNGRRFSLFGGCLDGYGILSEIVSFLPFDATDIAVGMQRLVAPIVFPSSTASLESSIDLEDENQILNYLRFSAVCFPDVRRAAANFTLTAANRKVRSTKKRVEEFEGAVAQVFAGGVSDARFVSAPRASWSGNGLLVQLYCKAVRANNLAIMKMIDAIYADSVEGSGGYFPLHPIMDSWSFFSSLLGEMVTACLFVVAEYLTELGYVCTDPRVHTILKDRIEQATGGDEIFRDMAGNMLPSAVDRKASRKVFEKMRRARVQTEHLLAKWEARIVRPVRLTDAPVTPTQ